jgi:hypothetical protein
VTVPELFAAFAVHKVGLVVFVATGFPSASDGKVPFKTKLALPAVKFAPPPTACCPVGQVAVAVVAPTPTLVITVTVAVPAGPLGPEGPLEPLGPEGPLRHAQPLTQAYTATSDASVSGNQ